MNVLVYPALFLVTLSTLMYEILLTRIFSVSMFYHFAFMAISVAMLGMTAGAVIVYLRLRFYSRERAQRQLALNSWAFSVSLALSFLVYLCIPFPIRLDLTSALSLSSSYVVISVPFVFSGITVALALTRVPRGIGGLYAADLMGAAAGCILLTFVLDITDAPSAVFVVAGLGACGSFLFSWGTGRRIQTAAFATATVLLAVALVHTPMAASGKPVIRIVHRILPGLPTLYARWNSFSYIEVTGDPRITTVPFTWGGSSRMPASFRVRQLGMNIDVSSGTPITGFDGDRRALEFLKYDVTNVAHYLRPKADVFVVGVGGGRDILSALAFDQKSVEGVEVNENVLDALNRRFGDFSGHLDRHPRVRLRADEARSYLERTRDRYDILQISLTDTFAATAAGAFALVENSLYTSEAWRLFLARLKPGGILTVSRLFFHGRAHEAYRITGLAVDALQRRGVANPRGHLLLVKSREAPLLGGAAGVGTLLVGRDRLTRKNVKIVKRVARELGYQVVLSPRAAGDPVLERIANGRDLDRFYASYPMDISPPTDDRPFFFQMLRLGDVFRPGAGTLDMTRDAYLKGPVFILGVLLVTVVVLTLLFVFVPLALSSRLEVVGRNSSLLLFFAAIGFGFMFIEIAQMQRLFVFLGHPTRALSVVLFTLLLASGMGSLLTDSLVRRFGRRAAGLVLIALPVVLIASGIATPWLTGAFAPGQTATRVALAAVLLAPMGFVMGMPFPLGMRVGAERSPSLLPWLWGVNGATSVCCSVVATTVSLAAGIAASFWAGVACYLVAAAAYRVASRGSFPAAGK